MKQGKAGYFARTFYVKVKSIIDDNGQTDGQSERNKQTIFIVSNVIQKPVLMKALERLNTLGGRKRK